MSLPSPAGEGAPATAVVVSDWLEGAAEREQGLPVAAAAWAGPAAAAVASAAAAARA
jgi:hypothetical protein